MLGYTPQQVDDMSIWQFVSACEGYADAHNPEDQNSLSAAEADELWDWMLTKH